MQDSFRSVPGLTPNQAAVGIGLERYVDAIPGLPDDIVAFLNGKNIIDLPSMYDYTTTNKLAAIFKTGFASSGIQNGYIQRHLERVSRILSTPGGYIRSSNDNKGGMVQKSVMTQDNNAWSVFIEAMGGPASVDGNRNANGYDFGTIGITVGADKRVSENLCFVLLESYGNSMP